MAVQLKFYGTEKTDTENHSLIIYASGHNEIFIKIEDNNMDKFQFISLDRETAIKLSKELRKQISLLD